MELEGKKFVRFPLLYGFIVAFANLCGVLIPNVFQHQVVPSQSMQEWMRYLSDHNGYADPIQYMSFIVPTVGCILYTRFNKRDFRATIINLPIAYSTIGISGWICYLLEEPFLLIIAKKLGYAIDSSSIFFSSLLNISLEAITTFTLAYFITETIHRRFILPKIFPDGKISRIGGVKQPSVKFLFYANYISVTLFPVIYLFLVFYSILKINESALNSNGIYGILTFIIIIGLIINAALISYFEKPIKILKQRIQTIKEGDYATHVEIVTNDSFGELADILNDMTDSIESKTKKIMEIQNSVITGMATMVESRDNSTGGHIKRTSDCVAVFIKHLKEINTVNLSENFCASVIKAAPMHDLGKIAVDDAILRKPGKFTDEEYEKMKSHSAEGARIVENVLSAVDDEEFKQIAINVAHYHHEKWNGQGYPEKISGEQIPLEARIMALADVFDALVSKRCYKDSFTYDKAFEIINESLGSHFDPVLGAEFIKCRPQLEQLYNGYLQ